MFLERQIWRGNQDVGLSPEDERDRERESRRLPGGLFAQSMVDFLREGTESSEICASLGVRLQEILERHGIDQQQCHLDLVFSEPESGQTAYQKYEDIIRHPEKYTVSIRIPGLASDYRMSTEAVEGSNPFVSRVAEACQQAKEQGLKREHAWLVLSTPGFSRAPFVSEDVRFTLDSYADLVVDIILQMFSSEHLKVLEGHSMGGVVANMLTQKLAFQEYQNIEVVLEQPAFNPGETFTQGYRGERVTAEELEKLMAAAEPEEYFTMADGVFRAMAYLTRLNRRAKEVERAATFGYGRLAARVGDWITARILEVLTRTPVGMQPHEEEQLKAQQKCLVENALISKTLIEASMELARRRSSQFGIWTKLWVKAEGDVIVDPQDESDFIKRAIRDRLELYRQKGIYVDRGIIRSMRFDLPGGHLAQFTEDEAGEAVAARLVDVYKQAEVLADTLQSHPHLLERLVNLRTFGFRIRLVECDYEQGSELIAEASSLISDWARWESWPSWVHLPVYLQPMIDYLLAMETFHTS